MKEIIITPPNRPILDTQLSDFLNTKESSIDILNAKIAEYIRKAGYGTKEGVIASLLAISQDFEHDFGVKLPYCFYGGHNNTNLTKFHPDYLDGDNYGVNPYWGKKIEPAIFVPKVKTTYHYIGLDCSGIIGWALYNSGYKHINRSTKGLLDGWHDNNHDYEPIGINHTDDCYIGEPGDFIYKPGHIVVIVHTDALHGFYYAVEAKGKEYGVIISKYSIKEIALDNKYTIIEMDDYYQDTNNLVLKPN